MSIELPDLIDQYVEKRNDRLALQRETDALAKEENNLKTTLIAMLEEENLTVAGSATNVVKLKVDDKPVVGDWDNLYAFIKETDSFDLLQRRLGEGAVKARWEDGVDVPGVSTYPVSKLTVSKAQR